MLRGVSAGCKWATSPRFVIPGSVRFRARDRGASAETDALSPGSLPLGPSNAVELGDHDNISRQKSLEHLGELWPAIGALAGGFFRQSRKMFRKVDFFEILRGVSAGCKWATFPSLGQNTEETAGR